MRLSLATAACVVSFALLAGCSGSSMGSGSNLPSTVPQAGAPGHQMPAAHGPISHASMPHGKMNVLKGLKLQLAGKLPSPFTKKALKQIIKDMESGKRPHWKYNRVAPKHVGAWTLNDEFGYMLGLKSNLKKTVTAVDVEGNACYEPVTAKEDANDNVWISCVFDASFASGSAQEYNSSGRLLNVYDPGSGGGSGCQPSYYYCFSEGESFDEGQSSTTVWLANTFTELFYCPTSFDTCYYTISSGLYSFPLGSPSATPSSVDLYGTYDSANNIIYEVGYLDADPSNNVYFTYEGCENAYPYICGFGLDEYPSGGGQPQALIPPGGIGFWGGIYVSGGGSTLNVIDQEARTNTQYALPWTGTPENVLGPTPTNLFGLGDPIQGTFNANSSKMAIGDGYGWIDSGVVATNKWKAIANINCTDGCFGTTYQPSDRSASAHRR
jgi:hypothetical protein